MVCAQIQDEMNQEDILSHSFFLIMTAAFLTSAGLICVCWCPGENMVASGKEIMQALVVKANLDSGSAQSTKLNKGEGGGDGGWGGGGRKGEN